MGLQETLDAMKKESIKGRPPEVVKALAGEVAKLVKSDIVGRVIKTGETLPLFSLPDEKGNLVTLRDLLSHGPVAVSFYRGMW